MAWNMFGGGLKKSRTPLSSGFGGKLCDNAAVGKRTAIEIIVARARRRHPRPIACDI
jgi:hypothetical protein